MPFVPTPPEQLPTPDDILARLEPAVGEGATGYIKPDDLQFAWQAFLSVLYHAAARVAEVSTAADGAQSTADSAAAAVVIAQQSADAARGAATTAQTAADSAGVAAAAAQTAADDAQADANIAKTNASAAHVAASNVAARATRIEADTASLHSYITGLTARLTALEAAVDPSEGELPVDVYSTTFPTVHWDAAAIAANPTLNLDDGATHRVTLAMRSGTPADLVSPDNSPVAWFDLNGALGHVTGTHADVATSVLKQWIEDGSILTVQITKADPAHPVLRVSKVQNVVTPTP
jgi:hypothetical protein